MQFRSGGYAILKALWDAEKSPSYRVYMTIASFSKEKLCMCDSECAHTQVIVVPNVLKVPIAFMVLTIPMVLMVYMVHMVQRVHLVHMAYGAYGACGAHGAFGAYGA